MAKQRKKKNKHEKQYPWLSKTDKHVYELLIIVMIFLFLGFLYFRFYWTQNHFIDSDSTLACSLSLSSIPALFPFCITALTLIGSVGNKYVTGKYPIFGNKVVNYYDTSKYLFTLPLLDKRYSFSEYKQKMQLSKAKHKIIAFIVVIIVTYLISLFGIFGRIELKTNSIEKFSCLNNLKEEYNYSEVVSYDIESNPRHHGKYAHPASISISLTLRNGKTMSFDYSDFNYNVYSMQSVTERFAHAEKHTDDTFLDEFFDEHDFTIDEKEVILNLFSK